MRTENLETVTPELLRASSPDEKSYVTACLFQTRSKVTANRTSTDNQNLHSSFLVHFEADGDFVLASFDDVGLADGGKG